MKLKRGSDESRGRKFGILATDHQAEQPPEGEAREPTSRGEGQAKSLADYLVGKPPEERISDVAAENPTPQAFGGGNRRECEKR
jgi:hypothetical protein